MNKQNTKLGLFFIIGLLTAFLVMHFISNYKIEKKNDQPNSQNTEVVSQRNADENFNQNSSNSSAEKGNINELSAENTVINYVKQNHQLPDYYLTKNEARKQGWIPSKGNLCDVLPGKAIGGDHFSNREKKLPSGNEYYEADVNYNCANRNADRIIFTENGEVWLTKDHYKTFDKQ
ncbi:ribonuclease domain-containing protein [Kaistella sp.]|uniref:ribonuclease domain-containing protein n=1 Tax=Kaistella sp. TaxID=2782235 RepID=UPI003C689979